MNQKRLFFLLLILLSLSRIGYATDYYFSSINGSDENDGLSYATPKQSMSALQNLIPSLNSGDRILLEKGSVWYKSSLNLSDLQITGSEVLFTSYGTGPMPVVSGEKILTEFIKNGNIYTAYDPELPDVSLDTASLGRRFTGYVTIDGQAFSPGRTPNEGNYYMSTACGKNYVSDEENWNINEYADAFVVMKNVNWQWNIVQITGNTSSTLSTTSHYINPSLGSWPPSGEKYYFIQNGINTLDQHGEWAQTDDAFYFYHTGTPQEVKVAVSDYLVVLNNTRGVKFQGIKFRGANFNAFRIDNSADIIIENCRIEGCGEGGLYVTNTDNLNFSANELTETNLFGILCRRGNSNVTIESNYIHKIGWREGFFNIKEMNPHGASIAWFSADGKATIKQNLIDTVLLGIQTHNSKDTYNISENLIRNYGYQLGDFAAFYTVYEADNSSIPKNFKRNIILDVHTHTNAKYTNYTNSYVHAVYMDESSLGVHADSNSIENCNIAYFSNGGYKRSFKYNKVNNPGVWMHADSATYVTALYQSSTIPMPSGRVFGRDTIVGNSIVFPADPDQIGYRFNKGEDYSCYFPIGSVVKENHYYDPYSTASRNIAWLCDKTTPYYGYDIGEWADAYFGCANANPGINSVHHTTQYAKAVLFKNFSASEHSFSLSSDYYDESGNLVTNSVAVAPFYSKLLFTHNAAANDGSLYIDESLIPLYKGDSSDTPPPPPPPLYTLTTSLTGSGTITPDGGTFPEDSVISIIATPTDGWIFDSWTGDTNSTENPIQLIMEDNISIQAVFVQEDSPTRTMKVNFGPASSPVPDDWNQITDYSAGIALTDLKDIENNLTGYSLSLDDSWTGDGSFGEYPGIYPDVVMQSYFYSSSSSAMGITVGNLNPDNEYELTIFASRKYYDYTTDYTVAGTTKSINVNSNTSDTVVFSQIIPDSYGNINIECLKQSGSNYTYINSLIIVEKVTDSIPDEGESILKGQINFASGNHTYENGWYNFPPSAPNTSIALWDNVVLTDLNGLSPGERGDITGSTFPDDVIQSYHYASNTGEHFYSLSNLDVDHTYTLMFLGSRSLTSTDRTTVYRVYTPYGADNYLEDSLNADGNTSNMAEIARVSTENGEITFSVRRSDSSPYAYLNALEIYAHPPQHFKSAEEHSVEELKIRAYPNPVNELLNLTGLSEMSTVGIYNILGELIAEYRNYDENQLHISVSDFSPGNYIIKITNEQTGVLKSLIITKHHN